MVSAVEIFGTLATIIGTALGLSYFIQIAKIFKTKSVDDLSIIMFSVFAMNATIWTIYGLLLNNLPLIIVNIVSVVGTYLVLGMILKYRKR